MAGGSADWCRTVGLRVDDYGILMTVVIKLERVGEGTIEGNKHEN
jgi:hypothetical protein